MPPDHDRQLLAHLGQQPGWRVLTKLAGERKQQKQKALGEKLFREEGVSEAERHYWRGYFDGLDYLIRNPTLEAKKLEESTTRED